MLNSTPLNGTTGGNGAGVGGGLLTSIKGSIMKSIDVKSLIIGILGTALVMVLMGVTHKRNNYQLACATRNCAVINTSNGKVKILEGRNAQGLSGYHPWNTEADF